MTAVMLEATPTDTVTSILREARRRQNHSGRLKELDYLELRDRLRVIVDGDQWPAAVRRLCEALDY